MQLRDAQHRDVKRRQQRRDPAAARSAHERETSGIGQSGDRPRQPDAHVVELGEPLPAFDALARQPARLQRDARRARSESGKAARNSTTSRPRRALASRFGRRQHLSPSPRPPRRPRARWTTTVKRLGLGGEVRDQLVARQRRSGHRGRAWMLETARGRHDAGPQALGNGGHDVETIVAHRRSALPLRHEASRARRPESLACASTAEK